MNTFQVGLIKKALGDSENFAQILQSALELSNDENALSKTDKSIVLGFFNQLDSFQLDVGQTVGFQDYTFKSLLVQNFRKYGKPSKGSLVKVSISRFRLMMCLQEGCRQKACFMFFLVTMAQVKALCLIPWSL